MNYKEPSLKALADPAPKPFVRRFLYAALLFLLGTPVVSHAAPGIYNPPYVFTVTVILDNQIADGTHNDIVEVTVTDGGVAAPGVSVNFKLQGATASNSLTTNVAGIVDYPVNSNVAGITTVSVTVNGVTQIVSVNFIAGPPSANPPGNPPGGTIFIVTQDNQPADGVSQNVVKAHISDQFGNPVGVGVSVVFTITGGVASGTAKFQPNSSTTTYTGTTDANGDIFLPITSTKVGDAVVHATLGGVDIFNSPQSVHFVVGPPSPNPPGNPVGGTNFFITQNNQVADGASQDKVKAHISDATGNSVGAGVLVTITITGNGTAAGTAQLPGNVLTVTLPTDVNGDVEVPITDIKSGTVEMSAWIVDPVTGILTQIHGSTQTVTFVAGPPSPNPPGNPAGGTNFFILTNNQTADGVAQDQVGAHISDANGNSVGAGVQVTITITGNGTAAGPANLPGNVKTIVVTTDVNGNVVIPITDIQAGTVELSASIIDPVTSVLTQIFGSTQTVTFVTGQPSPNPPGNPPGGTNFFITQDNQTADGVSQDMVKAHISDANGNPVGAGVLVTITITGNGTAAGQANLTGNVKTVTVATDANGDVVVPITDILVGTVEISASIVDPVTGNPTFINGSTKTVTFVVGAPSPNPPGNPVGGTNFFIITDNQTADGVAQDQVEAHISDASGNSVGAGVLVTITITGNGSAAGPANLPGNVKTVTVATDANGNVIVPITDIKAGKVELSASIIDPVTGNPAFIHGSTQTVTFVAGPAVPSAPLAPGGTGTMLSVTQNFRLADGVQVDSVLAHITDKFGNPVAGATVTFSITAGGTATSGAQFVGTVTLTTDANGNAEIALNSTVPGTVFVNGALGGVNIDGSYQTATFDNAPDLHNPETQLVVVVYEAIANGNGTTVVKAHVVDLSGNPMVGQDVVFAIDSGNAQMTGPATVATDANGDAFITLTSNQAGYVLITATVNGQSIIFGSPARVKFVPINIYVPRVFTPNNDGTNDVLKPILVGITTFHYFSVYNRWGNLIFTTQDANQGWDGTFKGVAQPVETYLWIAEGIDTGGKKVVQKGMVSLVR